MYKEIGNTIYGMLVRGISNKTKYDIQSASMKRMGGTKFSNPIMASWITAFVRSLLGELLHYVHLLGGKVVSVTTDGFITDIPDLENKVLDLIKFNKNEKVSMFIRYREWRY